MVHLDGNTLDSLWDFSDPTTSEIRFREALCSLSSSSPAADELRTQIARALGLQGQFAEGHTVLDGISSTDAVVRQRIALERGRLFNSAGDPTAARGYFLEARQLAADPFLTVDALHMLAIVEPELDTWYTEGIAIVAESSDPRVQRWEGSLRNNQAWNLADAGREEDALAAFRDAEMWFGEHGTSEQLRIARWSVAHMLRRCGHTDEARAILEELCDQGDADRYVDEELALLTGE